MEKINFTCSVTPFFKGSLLIGSKIIYVPHTREAAYHV